MSGSAPRSDRILRLGTRRSPLARAQSALVARAIEAAVADVSCVLVDILTTGDRMQALNPALAGGRGIFVKELERALLDGEVDACVHSAKDVPPELADGLCIAAYPERADPCDAMVAGPGATLETLARGARVGTGSPRRTCMLLEARPDLIVVPIRGNVDTRLRRIGPGDLDAVVLAAAGLHRLGLAERISQRLRPEQVTPAAGQGALAVEARAGDTRWSDVWPALDDADTALAVSSERAVLAALGGGCSAPAGALAAVEREAGGERLRLLAALGGSDGRVRRAQRSVALPSAEVPGARLAAAETLGAEAAAALR